MKALREEGIQLIGGTEKNVKTGLEDRELVRGKVRGGYLPEGLLIHAVDTGLHSRDQGKPPKGFKQRV